MLAELFGFTGWDGKTIDRLPEGWTGDVSKTEHCVVLVQKTDFDAESIAATSRTWGD